MISRYVAKATKYETLLYINDVDLIGFYIKETDLGLVEPNVTAFYAILVELNASFKRRLVTAYD